MMAVKMLVGCGVEYDSVIVLICECDDGSENVGWVWGWNLIV